MSALRPSGSAMGAPWRGVVREFRDILPEIPEEAVVTLLEGGTPLVPAPGLSRRVGGDVAIYVKVEGQNPTGSFKDRGMTVAVSRAKARGSKVLLCASTGNTSASAAAYAARAGMRCVVVIPEGQIASGKLAQAMIYGARVLAIQGNFDRALELVRAMSEEGTVTVVNSINPDRIEGQKTVAYEVAAALGSVPDAHALPVGNAGNITATWRGYEERAAAASAAFARGGASAAAAGPARALPRMLGFQAEGAAPIVRGERVAEPKTIATAIKIGNPASWKPALEARDRSGGLIDTVTDKEILAAYRMLAEVEGIFVEPASAASIAGVLKLASLRKLGGLRTIVCTVTGHGLKDPERAVAVSNTVEKVEADPRVLRKVILE
jgi:threonine synthase